MAARLDQLDIKPGQRWDKLVADALTACSRVLVVLSASSIVSDHVTDEFSFALDENKTVIPILCGECTMPFRLRRLQNIDFRVEYESGLRKLVKTLCIGRKH
jgi:TIR domain